MSTKLSWRWRLGNRLSLVLFLAGFITLGVTWSECFASGAVSLPRTGQTQCYSSVHTSGAGTGNGTALYNIDPNPGKSARSGTISVILTQNNKKKAFTVRQGNK